HHLPRSDYRADALDTLDTVLERDHPTAARKQRPDGLCGGLGVPELDREKHDVERAERTRVIAHRRRFQPDLARGAAHGEATLAHRCEMPPAGNERDLVPGLRKLRAEIAAHTSCTHHCDTHLNPARF